MPSRLGNVRVIVEQQTVVKRRVCPLVPVSSGGDDFRSARPLQGMGGLTGMSSRLLEVRRCVGQEQRSSGGPSCSEQIGALSCPGHRRARSGVSWRSWARLVLAFFVLSLTNGLY